LWIEDGERSGAPGIVLKDLHEITSLQSFGRRETIGLVKAAARI
jgi:hypothetical protein